MSNKTQVLEFNDHAYSSVYSAYSMLKNLSDPAREVRDKLNNPEHKSIIIFVDTGPRGPVFVSKIR